MDKHCFDCEYCDFELDDNLEYHLICENMLTNRYYVSENEECDYYKQAESIKEVAIHEKKNYELVSDISISKLEEAGFNKGGWIKSVSDPKYSIDDVLLGDISIHVEISNKDNIISFNDTDNVYVIDENFGQPYMPFYEAETGFSFLNGVIDNYNKFMDDLVNKGILQEKILDKKMVKKLNK